MHRTGFIVGLGALAAVIALIGMNFARNPVEARGAYVDAMLAELQPAPYAIRSAEGMGPDELVSAVSQQEAAWEPLVDAPPPAVAKPDLARMLAGVEVTRDKMGSPPNMKVRIKTPKGRRGEWMQTGDTVNGLTIKEITLEAVVFQLEKDGQVYEHSMPRPQR